MENRIREAIWFPLFGHEGLYEINKDGEIKTINNLKSINSSLGKRGTIILSPSKTGRYLRIGLSKEGKRKYHLVHRLIAFTFIPNPDNKPHINHINGIKKDNSIGNLEWCTQSENVKHGFDILNRRPTNLGITYGNHFRSKKVVCVNTGEVFDSLRRASEFVNGNKTSISSACKNNNRTYKGFKWKYHE